MTYVLASLILNSLLVMIVAIFVEVIMKPDIHPNYTEITVSCSCGSTFITRSTMEKDQLSLEVCAKCHPFYTGTQKIVDTAGRVDRFRQKYGLKRKEAPKPAVEAAS